MPSLAKRRTGRSRSSMTGVAAGAGIRGGLPGGDHRREERQQERTGEEYEKFPVAFVSRSRHGALSLGCRCVRAAAGERCRSPTAGGAVPGSDSIIANGTGKWLSKCQLIARRFGVNAQVDPWQHRSVACFCARRNPKSRNARNDGDTFCGGACRKWMLRRCDKVGCGIGEIAPDLNERIERGNVRQVSPNLNCSRGPGREAPRALPCRRWGGHAVALSIHPASVTVPPWTPATKTVEAEWTWS